MSMSDTQTESTSTESTSTESTQTESTSTQPSAEARREAVRRQMARRAAAAGQRPRPGSSSPPERKPSSSPARSDAYLEKQERGQKAIAKGASSLHLFLGLALSWLKTFFQRSILSIVAMLILLIGMALAAESYSLSAGTLPAAVLPKPGVAWSAAADNIKALIASFDGWQWFLLACTCFLAIAVQAIQWGSIRYLGARTRVGSTGGKLALSGWALLPFIIFVGALWWQDLQIVSGLYLAQGFTLGGLLVWFWAAFPSEIAEAFIQLQKSLPAED
jgi:hypothetical protein